MKKIIVLLIGLTGLIACQTTQKDGFTITGNIDGLKDSIEIFLIKENPENRIKDTLAKCFSKENEFVLSGKIDEPTLLFIKMIDLQQPANLFVENSNISVSGKLDSLTSWKYKGSKSQDDIDRFDKIFTPIQQEAQNLQMSFYQLQRSGDSVQLALIQQQYQANQQKQFDAMMVFAKENPNSFVSPFLAQYIYNLDYEEFKPIYEAFSNEVKNTSYAKKLKESLDKLEKIQINKTAPNLKGNMPSGEEFSLNDMNAKVILIDFWASWCGPCREVNPQIVEIYNKYHQNGFDILGVSLDDNLGAWKQAIEIDSLPWKQISDLKKWNSELSKSYSISSIPQTFLLDENKKIIAKNLEPIELEAKIKELLN